jgi:hypothetical protein
MPRNWRATNSVKGAFQTGGSAACDIEVIGKIILCSPDACFGGVSKLK